MTMKRKDKANHKFEMKMANQGNGLTDATFSSPREIAQRGGRTRMTVTEYRKFVMGRGTQDAGQARGMKFLRSRPALAQERAADITRRH